MKTVSSEQESALADLVSLWQRRRAGGEAAAPAELCRDRPELLPELQRRIAALQQMDGLAQRIDETLNFTSSIALATPVQGSPAFPVKPNIPGFEVQSVLGRGGMGIVYLARDTKLKRLVALKMVLAGAYSSEDSLGRFRAEAEAVARLQHPHVVQVFSWGEHGGLPYLVMEYVAGGGLDRCIAGKPQPPLEAARLVMLLARAVHAAHKAGIVHRDLKPANILLAPAADEPALNTTYGWPKISDFGLARLSGGERAQTASCDLLGTPSYMAPEQAAGKTREVGPAVDVYALGAIFYELLTGHPPFKGESVLETLDQVRSLPPRPPCQHCPEVPHEMEALCLSCLAKAPEDRPPTAADLAESLRRFLGEHPSASNSSLPTVSPLSGKDSGSAPSQVHAATAQPKPLSRQHWIAAGALFLVCTIGLVALLSHNWGTSPQTMPQQQPETLAVALEKLHVLQLDVTHYPTVHGGYDKNRVRVLGKDVFNTNLDDSVTVKARLSRPAYAFLIAFLPDGKWDVCFPEKDSEPPPLTNEPRYPLKSLEDNYGLEEGAGLQVFALVASSDPLPSFKDWWAKCQDCPWKKNDAPPGVVWRSDGEQDVEALTEDDPAGQRGKGKSVQGKTPVVQLAQWLRQAPQIEAVQVVGFAVMPKDKR